MKRFEVSFRPLAEADLFALYRYIAAEAGHAVAGAYINRIFHGGQDYERSLRRKDE